MKRSAAFVFATLCALAAATPVLAHEHCNCSGMPAPPAPPAPPAIPAMPAPPAPPAPPPAPVIPAQAHAACAARAPGTRMRYTPQAGTVMSGTCERDNRGMYFDLRSVQSRG